MITHEDLKEESVLKLSEEERDLLNGYAAKGILMMYYPYEKAWYVWDIYKFHNGNYYFGQLPIPKYIRDNFTYTFEETIKRAYKLLLERNNS